MDFLIKLHYYFEEMRVHLWFKNLLIFLCIIWYPFFLQTQGLYLIAGFFVLCISSSIVYLLNDWNDYDKDRKHPEKKKRPFASNKITQHELWTLVIVLWVILLFLLMLINNSLFTLTIFGWFLLHFSYTHFLKHIPVVELFANGLFYAIRTWAGFVILGVASSIFLLLTVFTLRLFIVVLQRYLEKQIVGTKARSVLKYYSHSLLRKLLVLFLMMSVLFYFIVAAFFTGPLVYTDLILFMILFYLHEFAYQYNEPAKKTDDVLKLLFSQKWIASLMFLLITIACAFTMKNNFK